MNLLARVRSFVQDHHLLTTGDGVVVGVSGGPDSLCLLHLLLRLRDEYALALHVAHLHHGARGADADADAAFVSALAHRWGLPVTVVRRDVPAIAAAHKLAFEEAARRVRYTFLAQDVFPSAGQNLDEREDIEVVLRPLSAIPRLIRDREITHALVLAAFYRFFMEYGSDLSDTTI